MPRSSQGVRSGASGPGAAGRAPPWPGAALALAMAVVAALVALWCAAGIAVRATHGARTTADEPQYLLTAISLAEDGDLDIADELAGRRWRAFHEAELPEQTRPLAGGGRLSPHGPLLPLLLALPVALGGWVGAKLALAAMAGLLAALLLWIAVRRLGTGPGPAVLVVLACCLAPPLAVYGTQVYPELPAALALAAALAALTGPLRGRGLLAAGGAVVALPWLGTKYAPVAGVVAVLVVVRLGRAARRRAAAAWVAALAGAGAAYALAHLALYGGLTPYAVGDHFVGGELTVVGAEPDYVGRSARLLGLLVDRSFGLAAWQPVWLAAVAALAALVRRRPPGWDALAWPLAAGWLVASFVALTMHGWWWPGRQVVVVLPAGALALAWWMDSDRAGGRCSSGRDGPAGPAPARRRLMAVAALGAAGVVSFAWLVADGIGLRVSWVVGFEGTGNPLYRAWRHLLPDYREPGAWTWWLHGAWLAALAALALAGWRGERPDR
jgi:hypothetical protein